MRGRHAAPTPQGMPVVQPRSAPPGMPMAQPYPVPQKAAPPPPAASPSLPYPAAVAPPALKSAADGAKPRGLSRGTIILLVVLVVLGGLGAAGYFVGWPRFQQSQATLLTPANVIGVPKLDSPDLYRKITDDTWKRFSAHLGQQPLLVVYAAADDPKHFIGIGIGTKFSWSVGLAALNKYFVWASEVDNHEVIFRTTGIHKVSAGPMGGVAECGRTLPDGGDAGAACMWLDYGTVGFMFFPNRTPDEAAVLMRAIRPLVVHRKY
jgi:hypothetical protein